ncbi:uncharacterized protein CG4951 isoform X1 [Drosophila erecta]|uniref:GG12080 n=1 Tax=Drosophila erecta TaxID=7220 RepID=B3P5V3_DROER|nr:uncharacterized protein CG4951 isoform X1 [Drosophila erecta]EDV53353.1 uncharacterized protein Dere_GG12080 [Drosophila erecta]
MSFSAIGDCQLVSQIYQYKRHRVVCSVKVLPTPVTHFERERKNVFHWMTADRWCRIESGLWRLFENLKQWQDAFKLNTELIIDHINVRVQATDEPNPATLALLAGAESTSRDLFLDIQLQYITHEDTTIVGVIPAKRKLATEAETNGTSRPAKSGLKPKAGTQSKPRHIDADNEDDKSSTSGSQPAKIKRERRSISEVGGKDKISSSSSSSQQSSRMKRSHSPVQRNSRANSVEPKPARRSGRSPIRPSRFKNFVVGETRGSKSKGPKLKAEKGFPLPAKGFKVEQMDGARFDALQRLDSMLDMPKPREVKILLLEKMVEDEVLNTFENYRNDFDKLFKEREFKPRTSHYMNIAHMDIIDILSKGIQQQMLKKLGEVYSSRSNHTALLLNGLLPLWIVRLFMDTYKLSHSEAVQQIRDQMKYNTYLKALNDEPLSSDLD